MNFLKFFVITALLGFTGCASQNQSLHRVSPIQAQADDFKVTVAQTALAGAVLGGLTGAIVGGGDAREIVTGALVGGAAGAVGGYVIAGQKQSYASKEDALNSVLADSQQRNDKLARILSTTDRVVSQRRTQLSHIQSATSSSEDKLKAKKALLADLDADKAALEQAIASAQTHGQQIDQNISELKRQFPDSETSPLDQLSQSYRDGLNGLNQKTTDIINLIDQSSRIGVAS